MSVIPIYVCCRHIFIKNVAVSTRSSHLIFVCKYNQYVVAMSREKYSYGSCIRLRVLLCVNIWLADAEKDILRLYEHIQMEHKTIIKVYLLNNIICKAPNRMRIIHEWNKEGAIYSPDYGTLIILRTHFYSSNYLLTIFADLLYAFNDKGIWNMRRYATA